MSAIDYLPCNDSDEMASSCRRRLDIPRAVAAELGRSALRSTRDGYYTTTTGKNVVWSHLIKKACESKESIEPTATLPHVARARFDVTRVHVTNETTLEAARRLSMEGMRPLALNFANGIHPGGGFLSGARAQEEVLCRSSALFPTLEGDKMYLEHRKRSRPDSTDWAILSPSVPVFRMDDGVELEEPWLLSVVTCAAPVAHQIGQPQAGDLLRQRIHRVLAIAQAFGHTTLVLGAWGCGAFGNDTRKTAIDFRSAIEGEFLGSFQEIVFAITDWSPERRFLGPFRDVLVSSAVRGIEAASEP
jgi:uncharacterized protein (TIGR02452 family)